jgi:hypothetical protein
LETGRLRYIRKHTQVGIVIMQPNGTAEIHSVHLSKKPYSFLSWSVKNRNSLEGMKTIGDFAEE